MFSSGLAYSLRVIGQTDRLRQIWVDPDRLRFSTEGGCLLKRGDTWTVQCLLPAPTWPGEVLHENRDDGGLPVGYWLVASPLSQDNTGTYAHAQ